MNKPPIRWLLLALAASPAVIPLVLILKFGVNMPYWDEWSPNLVGLFIKVHEHRFSFWDLTAQHNEHRIIVPRLLYLVLGLITGGNTIAVMIAIWLSVCVTSVAILQLAARTTPREADSTFPPFLSIRVLAPFFVANLLLFTPAQWENWLWSMGLANVLSVMFIVLAICAACSHLRIWSRTSLAIAMTLLATFSAANGLLAWPIAGVILGWSASKQELKSKAIPLAAWIGAFVVAIMLYLVGYKPPDHSATPGGQAASLGSMAVYVLAFLGNAFTFGDAIPEVAAGVTMGAIILILLLGSLAYFLMRNRSSENGVLGSSLIVWLGVACIGFGSALMAALFRAGDDARQPLTSRYVTFSIYAIVALIYLIPLILDDLADRLGKGTPGVSGIFRTIGLVAMAIFLALYAVGLRPNWQTCRMARLIRAQGKAALLLSGALPDNPQFSTLVGPDPRLMLKLLDGIEQAGYFHPMRPETANAQAIEATDPAGAPLRGKILDAQTTGDNIRVSGWAIDPAHARPADAVFLTFDNPSALPIIFVMADIGVALPDMAAQLNLSSANCGWTVTFPLRRVPPANGPIRIRAWTLDIATCKAHALPQTFEIQPPRR